MCIHVKLNSLKYNVFDKLCTYAKLILIGIKVDLALYNRQMLICHKPKETNKQTNK